MTDPTDASPTADADYRTRRSGRFAALAGAGILLSRLAGLVREIAIAGFLGNRAAADAFGAALRIPKLLQNLLGEGSLSASFIPVYAKLLEDGDDERAGRVAGSVFGLLTAATSALVLLAIAFARPLTKLIAPGFEGEKLDLTVALLQIMVGGVGFLVLAAWCLGVLNAHRRFFLSYVAPVVWNAAIVAALVTTGVRGWATDDIATAAAWGVLIGGALQFLVQVPLVRASDRHLKLGFGLGDPSVREVLTRFGPAVAGRGVVTLSSYIDVVLASLLATGAIAALDRSQVLYLLPISAFALSVAAAELPELSRESGDRSRMVQPLRVGFDRIAFFLVYSSMALIVMGELIVSLLFERGEFGPDDTLLVWLVVAAYSLGMVPAGSSRLLQSACYAMGDVGGPARIAGVRMLISAGLGFVLMLQGDQFAIVDGSIELVGDLPSFSPVDSDLRNAEDAQRRLGAVGLALGASVAAWTELFLLNRRTRWNMPESPSPADSLRRLGPALALSAVPAALAAILLRDAPPIVAAPLAILVSGLVYLVMAHRAGNQAAVELLAAVRGRVRARLGG